MASPDSKTDICNLALGRIGAKRVTEAQITADPCTDVTATLCNLHYEQTRDALLRSYWWRFAGARAKIETHSIPDFEWNYGYILPADFLAFRSVYEDNSTLRQNTIYPYALEGSELLSDEAEFILSITDGATAGIGITILTSANGGFTEAMVDKYIYLSSGTNLTIGWYQITGYTNTNTVTLASAPDDGVGGVSGASGKIGGTIDVRYTKQVTTVTDFDPLFIEVLTLQLALKLVMPIAQDLKLYQAIKDDLKLLMPKVRAMDRQEQSNAGRIPFNTWNQARASNRGRLDSQLGSA